MTKEQILNCTDEDLPKMAGEILQPDSLGSYVQKDNNGDHRCIVCGKKSNELCNCKIPCLVRLTWDNAMKWRDWAVEKFGSNDFLDAFEEVMLLFVGPIVSQTEFEYRYIYAQPTHYIKAAMLCAVESEGE